MTSDEVHSVVERRESDASKAGTPMTRMMTRTRLGPLVIAGSVEQLTSNERQCRTDDLSFTKMAK